ncbi:MAG TPA: AsmA family protein, partial [candidate division Zixibacteria bacterium]|nr:AsmA family protein [candidate division Zixibacteria bacterium]
MKKTLLWTVGVVVGLAVVGYGALLLFFPAERLRVYLEETGAEYTGQPVSIGDLSVSLWGGVGVTLDSVVIGEESDSLRLAQISDIDVKVRFWPLLRGEYVVDRLIVTRPRLMLVRFADGSSNFAVTAPSEAGAAPETMETEAGVLLGGLSFGSLEIREGAVRRLDQATGADSYLFGLDFEGNLTPTAPNQFTSNGTVTWSSLRHQGTAAEKPLSLPALSVKYAVDYDAQADSLQLRSVTLTSAAGVMTVGGVIEEFSAAPRASLSYSASGLALAELFAAAPELAVALPAGWGAQAELAVSGEVAYADDTLTYNGA